MPVSLLLVEGKLDMEILTAIFNGHPTVREAGAKYSLAPRTRIAREENGQGTGDICYLRDRDFDYEPPRDTSRPEIDRPYKDGSTLGWHWCRHEIENYLIDPDLVALAKAWNRDEYATALTDAATRIRHYQVARWAIGTVRRQLRPPHQLRTRPEDFGNSPYTLPTDLSAEGTSSWASAQTECFREHVERALSAHAVQIELGNRRRTLSEELLADPGSSLLWCSGKDLLAALEPWLADRNAGSPATFINQVRDWVRENPERAVASFPEWDALARMLAL